MKTEIVKNKKKAASSILTPVANRWREKFE